MALVAVWHHPGKRAGSHPCTICDELDGREFSLGSGPEPPVHPHCDCEVVVEEREDGAEPFEWNLSEPARGQLVSWLAWLVRNGRELPEWTMAAPVDLMIEVYAEAEVLHED